MYLRSHTQVKEYTKLLKVVKGKTSLFVAEKLEREDYSNRFDNRISHIISSAFLALKLLCCFSSQVHHFEKIAQQKQRLHMVA